MTILLIILAIYCILCWAIGIAWLCPSDADTWDAMVLLPILLPIALIAILFKMIP